MVCLIQSHFDPDESGGMERLIPCYRTLPSVLRVARCEVDTCTMTGFADGLGMIVGCTCIIWLYNFESMRVCSMCILDRFVHVGLVFV